MFTAPIVTSVIRTKYRFSLARHFFFLSLYCALPSGKPVRGEFRNFYRNKSATDLFLKEKCSEEEFKPHVVF